MKYKFDINKIPNNDEFKRDRNEVRRRNKAIKKFGSLVNDKYWWDTLSEGNKWSIYINWTDYIFYVNRKPNKEAILKFILNEKIKYPGDINTIRDNKIDDILK